MLIVGAGGLAAQLFEDLVKLKKEVVFWTEVETKYKFIEERFPLIGTDAEVIDYFANVSKEFVLCVGNDKSDGRRKMSERFKKMGGDIFTFVSPFARISPYGTSFGKGSIILGESDIEAGVTSGEEIIMNKLCGIGHGCHIGSYSELGPGVILTGEVEIEECCYLGAGVIVHPKVKLGRNVTVAAGAVVTKNVPEDSVVAGVPAEIKFKKKNVS